MPNSLGRVLTKWSSLEVTRGGHNVFVRGVRPIRDASVSPQPPGPHLREVSGSWTDLRNECPSPPDFPLVMRLPLGGSVWSAC